MTTISAKRVDELKGMTAEFVTQVLCKDAEFLDVIDYFDDRITDEEAEYLLDLIPDAAIFFQWPEADNG